MADLIHRLASSHGVIVLDTPPVLGVTDAAIMARYAAGVVVVVDSRRSSRRRARRAIAALRAVDAPIVGIAFNRVPRSDSYGYGYSTREGRALSKTAG